MVTLGNLKKAMGLLSDFSIVVTETGGKFFGIHRLVQLATRNWFELHDKTEKWKQKAISLLSSSFPFAKYENLEHCRVLLLHADAVLEYQNLDQNHFLKQADIFYSTAAYSWNQRDYRIALAKNHKAINIRCKFLGEESEKVLNSLHFHAILIAELGKIDEVE